MLVEKKGFTLIELLIVMGIMAIMTTIVLIMLNPPEKFALTRDSARVGQVAQMGRLIKAYRIENSTYPDVATWDADLTLLSGTNFINRVEYAINNATPCSTNARPASDPTYCYDYEVVADNAIIYSKLEAQNNLDKCPLASPTYFVYSSADGRTGYICQASDPAPWVKGAMTYVQ